MVLWRSLLYVTLVLQIERNQHELYTNFVAAIENHLAEYPNEKGNQDADQEIEIIEGMNVLGVMGQAIRHVSSS